MMRFVLAGLSIAISAYAMPTAADEAEFRIGPRVGPGDLRINAGQTIGDQVIDSTFTEETVGAGGTFEYRAPFGLVMEVGLFTAGSTDWFDSQDYRYSEYFGSIGYQVDLGRGFSLIPRVGRARWKLEADNDWFFDDDDDRDPPAIRGYQNYWEITGLKRINPTLTLGVSHKENNFDFGRERSTVFTVMFNLR